VHRRIQSVRQRQRQREEVTMATALFDYPLVSAEPTNRPGLHQLLVAAHISDMSRAVFLQIQPGAARGERVGSTGLCSAVHRSIERHFRELLVGNPPPDGDTLLAEFCRTGTSATRSRSVSAGTRMPSPWAGWRSGRWPPSAERCRPAPRENPGRRGRVARPGDSGSRPLGPHE